MAVSPAGAQAVKGETRVDVSGGYARIVVHLAEEVESDVRIAGGIVVVGFKRPVDAGIEKVASGASEYIGAARRDPDGRGFRIALSRKLTVNSMAAGERLFIDLLPETWTGVPPGLPKEVIEDLARRAREAERTLRAQRQVAVKTQKPARVRVATQPTFTRYVFELPDVIAITSDRGADDLTIVFGAPLKFELIDAKMSLPASVKSIDSQEQSNAVSVRFVLNGKVDVRSFREDKNYVVDIGASDAKETTIVPKADEPASPAPQGASLGARNGPLTGVEPPQTVPAKLQQPAAPKMSLQAATAPAEAAAARAAPAQVARGTPAQPPVAAAQATPQATPQAAPRAAPAPPAPESPKPQAEAKSEPQSQSKPALAEAPKAAPAAAQPAQPVQSAPAETPAPVRQTETQPQVPESAPSERVPQQSVERKAAPRDPNVVAVELVRQGDSLRLVFPFVGPTPAAVFRRADTLWLVFDAKARIDLSALQADTSKTIRTAQVTPLPGGQVVRLVLERPRLTSAATEGLSWVVTIGDAVLEPTRPLGIARNIAGMARASVTVPFDQPHELHRVADPEIGDTMLVVTALPPARGFLKTQEFVEFRALASTHGVAIQAIADDVQAEISADKIVISRPGGLTLSGSASAPRNSAAYRAVVFDPQLWGFDRQSNFTERQYKLIAAAADATQSKRVAPRLDLARFYLSRDMFTEAKGVLDVALADDRPTADDPTGIVLRAIAEIMLGRPDEALKELSHPLIGNQHDAPLWRAFAYARQGKWAEARQGFKNVEAAIGTLPIELQRLALKEALRAAIEVHDFAGAANQLHEFETVGMPREFQPAVSVLQGRLAQGLGKTEDALKSYRAAADSADRPSAAQGQLREFALRYELGDLKQGELISELETLTALWRGDETEIEALQMLARLYTEQHRYRDAFYVMRTALSAHPNSEMTRRIQEEAAVTFDSLFLAGRGDALPAIDALSLFYDFRELTPIGRRGDEMIRRLADRLVSVDLLYQAAELLQHQVDHRLQGAARAQVATRLAVVYLMDAKPDRAQAVLRGTRVSELSTDLRNLRLLLEARALSDIGRHDLALEVVANIDRPEAIRLRSDILWAAKRYGEAAEQIELLLGERWKDFEPLNDAERADVLRAAIGLALVDDAIGIGRLKEKFAAKMTDGPDRRSFEIATAPHAAKATEFRDIARTVSAFNTLEVFLRDMRARYPEIGALSAVAPRPVQANKAAARPVKADLLPTGLITASGQRRAATR